MGRVPGGLVVGLGGPREGLQQLDRHRLDGRRAVDAVVHLGALGPPLRQLRPHPQRRHRVRVQEVVAHVQLVEGQRHPERRERCWLLLRRAQERDAVVGSV